MKWHQANTADFGLMHAQAYRDSIGFVAPTLLYDQMRSIDASAKSLAADFARNVNPQDPTRQAFESWLSSVWTPFFTKTTGTLGAKLANAFFTDDLQKQIDTHRLELDGFYHQYEGLHLASGQPVPAPSAPGVPQPPPPSPETPAPSWIPSFVPKIEIPWYAWLALGAATVGGGYVLYRVLVTAHEEARETRKQILSSPLLGMAALDASKPCATCGH